MKYGFRVGSLAVDSEADVKFFKTAVDATKHSSFRYPDDTYYQVPAGKVFIITHIQVNCLTSPGGYSVGYGDDTVWNSAVAPTNYKSIEMKSYFLTAFQQQDFDVYLEIPAQKYGEIYGLSGNVNMGIIGIEI